MVAADPLVSILLPVRDAAATLPAALRSIVRQRESRWECVAVDDGSRDDTLACRRAFAERDARLVLIATPRRGLVAALNAGIARCRGRFVARMDADDRRLGRGRRAAPADPQRSRRDGLRRDA